jgi:hypothetical protein
MPATWLEKFFSMPDVTFYQIIAYLGLATFNAPWFWFIVVAVLGGFSALAQFDEDPQNKFSFLGGIRMILNRAVISVFIGLMIWLCAEWTGYATSPAARLAAGLGGFYGIKTIDWMIDIGRDFVETWIRAKKESLK